jgi:flagellar basal-body rod modification protein FlgD
MIASNFTTFLQLLTTQLQNQDPLSPMDTNQFTQQLVEFAQVEQQMKSNDQLTSLVSLQTSAQASQALAYVGSTVVVDGSSAQMTNSQAKWSLNVSKPATATSPSPTPLARPSIPASPPSSRAARSSPGTGSAPTASNTRMAPTS